MTTTASQSTTTATPATKPNFAIRFGRSKSVATVNSFDEASDVWIRLRAEHGFSASNAPKVTIVDLNTGKTVACISYNGRVWEGDKLGGKEIRTHGSKTAKEHSAEGWSDFAPKPSPRLTPAQELRAIAAGIDGTGTADDILRVAERLEAEASQR
jgi:hypothetical protein